LGRPIVKTYFLNVGLNQMKLDVTPAQLKAIKEMADNVSV
jgi:hypothetical protein